MLCGQKEGVYTPPSEQGEGRRSGVPLTQCIPAVTQHAEWGGPATFRGRYVRQRFLGRGGELLGVGIEKKGKETG